MHLIDREAAARVADKWCSDIAAAGDQFDGDGEIYRCAAVAQRIAHDIRALPAQQPNSEAALREAHARIEQLERQFAEYRGEVPSAAKPR